MIYDILLSLVENPVAIPAYAVFLMSAAMFPLGFMLGSPCSACCGCVACLKGKLPDTVTVTLSGYTDEKFPTQWLATFTIFSDFWTSDGGAGHVTEPDACGDPDTTPPSQCAGPIEGIELTETGTNYAKYGHRVPPYLEAVPLSGTGGQFSGEFAKISPSWVKIQNPYTQTAYSKLPAWRAASPLKILDPGDGYEYGMYVTLTAPAEEGMTVHNIELATGWAKVAQQEPTPVIDTSGLGGVGLDIELTVAPYTWTKYPAQPHPGMLAWVVTGSVVNNGGSGYQDDTFAPIEPGEDGVRILAGDMRIRTVRAEPIIAVEILQAVGGGSGAEFEIQYQQTQAPSQLGQYAAAYYSPQWRIVSVTVTNGGSGYSQGDSVQFNTTGGASLDYFAANATATLSVDANTGAILAVNLDPSPPAYPFKNYYYRDTGVVDRIQGTVFATAEPRGGLYYRTNGEVTEVVMTSAPSGSGLYWVEDPGIPALVAEDIVFRFTQYDPSQGTGETLQAVIDTDTSSPTFGNITGVTIVNGGDGFLARWWSNAECCQDYWNGKSFVLEKTGQCTYSHQMCGTHAAWPALGSVTVEYSGGSATVTVSDGGCGATMSAEGIVDCDEFSFEATLEDGPTASVVAGGEYNEDAGIDNGEHPCHPCCRSEQESTPAIVSARVKDTETGEFVAFGFRCSPPYSPITELLMSRTAVGTWTGGACVGGIFGGIDSIYYGIVIVPCSEQTLTGGWASVQGTDCDNCWKKCEPIFLGDQQGGYYWYRTERCSKCSDFPVCDALTNMTGEIPLLSDYDTGPNGRFVPGLGGGWLPGPNKIGELPPFPTKYVLLLGAG